MYYCYGGLEMQSKFKASLLTLIVYIVNSIMNVAFGLLYNNCLIRIYGSEINGLISTLNQFVSMFMIIEGGFTTAATVAAYLPIVNKDIEALNDLLYTVKRIYLKIGLVITINVIVFGSLFVLIIDNPLPYIETFKMVLISASTMTMSLCVISKTTVLLQGDNKEYISILVTLFSKVITWGGAIVLMLRHVSIIIVFAMNFIGVLINTIMIKTYERKKYSRITSRGKYNKKLVSGTGDVLFQKIANTVFTSTDLVLISLCTNLSNASVYNLYFLIFKTVLSLMTAVTQAPFNSFGQLNNERGRRREFNEYFEVYQHIVLIVSTIMLSVTGAMIIPFIRLYSKRFFDINYIYPSLAFLFYSQIFAQIVNRPFGLILNATGWFKKQNIQCALAVIVNIVVSVGLIEYWGMNSVVFGSFVGTMIILVMNIIQTHSYVLKGKSIRIWINIVLNYFVGLLIILVSFRVKYVINTIGAFLLSCFISTGVVIIVVIGINFVIDYRKTILVFSIIKRILKKVLRADIYDT